MFVLFVCLFYSHSMRGYDRRRLENFTFLILSFLLKRKNNCSFLGKEDGNVFISFILKLTPLLVFIVVGIVASLVATTTKPKDL